MPLYEGFLLDSSGSAVNGATVDLVDRNTSSPVRATTTTDSNGFFSIDHGTEGRFDIRITSGSDVVWRRYDTAAQMKELETATLKVRNPADTFVYDIVPGAITANRTLNLPVITGTDTLAALGLAQTFSELQTFSSGIDVTDTTDATSPTSAPVKSAGGLAVAKKAYFADEIILHNSNAQTSPNIETSYTTGVSTTATAIHTPAGHGAIMIVLGENDSIDEAFIDLIVGGGVADPTVIQSFASRGTPDGRTYSRSGSSLELTMASNTYNVIVTEIAGGNP